MDMNSSLQQDTGSRRTSHANGSVRRTSGGGTPTFIMGAPTPGRPISLPESPNSPSQTGHYHRLTVIVHRDENGYGMKVSGDNPVFVQSVKPGGAAEKAGLHAGDRIVEVNGEDVLSSTHTEVVALIKSSTQVILKVQHKTSTAKSMGSPGVHGRQLVNQNNQSRITGPQPVDNEKQVQLQLEREQHYRLMIEKEQRYVDVLRSQIVTSSSLKKCSELEKAERNLEKLFGMLQALQETRRDELTLARDKTDNPPPLPSTPPPKQLLQNRNGNGGGGYHGADCLFADLTADIPPPLPKRNNRTLLLTDTHNNKNAPYINGIVPLQEENGNEGEGGDGFLSQCLTSSLNHDKSKRMFTQSRSEHENLVGLTGTAMTTAAAAAAAAAEGRDRCSSLGSRSSKSNKNCKQSLSSGGGSMIVDNKMYASGVQPPPLPPRVPLNPGYEPDGANSINKQMSYPLVATCATLVHNCVPNHTHQRTKSSPESLIILSPSEASKRLIASESMNDLSRMNDSGGYERNATPPGTPPPPYPSPLPGHKSMSNRNSANTDDGDGSFEEIQMDAISSPDVTSSPFQMAGLSMVGSKYMNSSPIHAATPPISQQSIITMEDDEISESDLSQIEDHGPFKSISQLWHKENLPYLAVFVNYVLSNCDPFSLLFYLITDLYKEGNAKEMRKWAYEIQSCFLIPGAPLRICNVDESVVREIDEVLISEYTGEEILRKIFWKARIKAKEELTKLLAEFQQKRVAGMSNMFGPKDALLAEIVTDKTGGRDIKLYEYVLLEKLNQNDDSETVLHDPKKYYTTAALITVSTRVFGIRVPSQLMDRWQTFVNKEKSLRTKFIGRYSRKLSVYGHQYVAQQYYTVINCNNCTQIIFGIGPQGYICSACHINLHRNCISHYNDHCPGPMRGKGMKIKLMDRIRNEKDQKRKQSTQFIQMEKDRRMAEEKDNGIDLDNEAKPGNPVTRTPSDRRPDAVREESRNHDTHHGQSHDNENDNTHTESSVSLPASTTGSKQRQNSNINRSESVKEHSEKNRKQKRNVSDPLHTSDALMLIDSQGQFQQHSGSSSNSSLSSRSFDSPFSNAEEDSDLDVEHEPPDWKSSLTADQLNKLHTKERARQDVINELFHTERSHVRNLKVLDQVFRTSIAESRVITESEQSLVFSNLSDILSIHNQFNIAMKKKRAENPVVTDIGDLLLGMFDGDLGHRFCVAVSKYCEKQQLALELISEKRKKDSKFQNVLHQCEKHNLCRRLPLQGLIPQEMQRTTKYKLLVERLIDIEEDLIRTLDTAITLVELDKLKLALDKIKNILNSVNEAAKLAYNEYRLDEIRSHMEIVTLAGRSDGITQFNDALRAIDWKLVREGTVMLKRQNKVVPIQMLLLKEAVILLHKEGERFTLKSLHVSTPPIAPIIKISNLICRPNAADMTCLFLLSNAQNSQMYEIQCPDETDRKTWFKYLTEASEPYKSRDGKNKRVERNHDPEEDTTHDLPTPKPETIERVEPICESDLATGSSSSQRNSATLEEDGVDKASTPVDGGEIPVQTIHTVGEGGTVKLTANDWPLIQPSEVQVAETSVHTAEPILTPLEKIKRKDEEVKKALADKEVLVADLLSIPRENYRVIADMISLEAEKKTEVEPCDLVLASVHQVNELISAVNDSLNITEADAVVATGGKHASCNSNEPLMKQNHVPSVPASKIQNIATTLMSQLTILLSSVKQRDEESEKMRKELHRLREQLHDKCNLHPPRSTNHHDSEETVHQESAQSGDLESIEESPIETETT